MPELGTRLRAQLCLVHLGGGFGLLHHQVYGMVEGSILWLKLEAIGVRVT